MKNPFVVNKNKDTNSFKQRIEDLEKGGVLHIIFSEYGDPSAADNSAALQALITAADGAETFIVIKGGTYNFNSISIPANINFVVYPDSLISPNSGETVDILGEVIRFTKYQQIFTSPLDENQELDGVITGLPNMELDPTMWGAGHDLNHAWEDENDRPIIQYVFDLAAAGSKKVKLPARKFYTYHDSDTEEGTGLEIDSTHSGIKINVEEGFLLQVYGYTHGLSINDDADIDDVKIHGHFHIAHDASLDGSVVNAFGIRAFMGGTAKINNLEIDGSEVEDAPANGISVWNARKLKMKNIKCHGCQSHGVSAVDAEGFINGIRVHDNLMYGFDASENEENPLPNNLFVTDIDTYGNGFGLKTACSGKITFDNCRIKNNKNEGINKTRDGVEITLSNIESEGNGSAALEGGVGDATIDTYKITNFSSKNDNLVLVETTVSGDSSAGQKNLYVNTTGFEPFQMIIIDEEGASQEVGYIKSVEATHLVLKDNLQYDHLAVNAHTVAKKKSNGTIYFSEDIKKVQAKNVSISGAGRMGFVTQCADTDAEIRVEGNQQWGSVHVLGAGGGELALDIQNEDDGEVGLTFNSSGTLKLRGKIGTATGILINSAATGTIIDFGTDLAGCTTKVDNQAADEQYARYSPSTKLQVLNYQVEDLGAGVDIANRVLASIPDTLKFIVMSAEIIPHGSAAGIDDGNTCAIELTDGTNIIVSKTYDADPGFPAVGTPDSLGTPSEYKVIDGGGKLVLNITNGATANPPAMMLQITYRIEEM